MNAHPMSPIFLVEDNPLDLDLACRAFASKRLANPLLTARDGDQAVQMLRQFRDSGRLPIVMLLDLKLPRLSGLEVLQFMAGCEQLRRVPTIMLTSSKDDKDISEAYRLGATAYIVKPVDFENFMRVAETIHLHWCVFTEPRPQATV